LFPINCFPFFRAASSVSVDPSPSTRDILLCYWRVFLLVPEFLPHFLIQHGTAVFFPLAKFFLLQSGKFCVLKRLPFFFRKGINASPSAHFPFLLPLSFPSQTTAGMRPVPSYGCLNFEWPARLLLELTGFFLFGTPGRIIFFSGGVHPAHPPLSTLLSGPWRPTHEGEVVARFG